MEGSNNLKTENQQDIRRVMMSSNLIIIFKGFDKQPSITHYATHSVIHTLDFAHTHTPLHTHYLFLLNAYKLPTKCHLCKEMSSFNKQAATLAHCFIVW